MQRSILRTALLWLGLSMASAASFAVVSQSPLLSKTVNVRPNIALVLDTSGSMAWECVYAKHVNDALAVEFANNPGNIPGLTSGCLATSDRRQQAPVNNLLFYNPMRTYNPGYVVGVQQGNAPLLGGNLTVYMPIFPFNPAGGGSSAVIKDTTKYDTIVINSTGFKKNTGGVSATTNPFGTHIIPATPTAPAINLRPDCASNPCTLNEERINIANWDAYHKNRISAAKTGLTGAFVSQNDNFRLAYTDIYTNISTRPAMTDFGLAQTAFYTWLDGRAASGNTPLRTALDNTGKYFKDNTSNSGPWATKPWAPISEAAKDHLSCRRSYTVMITDGFYNDSNPPAPGDVDSNKQASPGYTYALDVSKKYLYDPLYAKSDPRSIGKPDKQSAPTAGYSNTLADIAMKYWLTDLRTDLPNDNGKGNPTDPPFWQNMTTYMVSFGAPGKMTDADVANAKLGKLDWVQPAPDTYTAIDDMRHAAHNGGGDFLKVTDAQQFATDLGNVIGSIASQSFSQAGVAASAVTLTTGTKKFVPYYTTGTWWGNLEMINLDGTGGNAGSVWKVISTDANGQPTGTTTIPSDTTKRNIVTWVNKTTQAIDFTYANVIAAGNSLKGTNTNFQMTNGVTSDIIDYLRGVRTKEGNGMRKRTAILGDIVNSTPAFIKNNTNPLYENLPSTTPGLSSYAQYMTDKAARKEGILMVGANDGMVHAFGEGYQTSVGGRELFAFIPRSVLGKLESLTQVGYNYAHTYTVDGPLNETDAYLTTPDQTTGAATTGWRNVVVGTTGAGAKSVFALNATNPLTMNGRSVLWEINPDPLFPVLNGNSSTSFQELGSVLTHPQSGITVSGDWVTIFGNGYDSKSGRASLFVVETGTGKLLREITTDTLTGNGLGGVRLVLNGNQQIIGAYAGDLQGRVWKFDLSSTASSGWKLGNGGSPLFTAMGGSPLKALPITAAPAILERNDQLSFKPSYMVTVATGKLFEAADPTTTSPTQMTYGLWDKQPFGVTTTNTVSETDLESVRIMQVTAGVSATAGNTLAAGGITAFYGVGFSNPSVTTIDWTTKRGWKMSMDVYAGQRVVYPVQMVGDVVKIDSVAPEASASSCRNTDSNAMSLYFNPLTGACLKTGTVDINGDGVIDEKDAAVCAYSSTADGMDVILKILNPDGSDSNLRDIQNSNGHIKAKVRETPPKKDCSDPDYKVAHQQPAPVGCGPVADCSDPAYRQANSGSCPGSTLNRSWRQIFPRAN